MDPKIENKNDHTDRKRWLKNENGKKWEWKREKIEAHKRMSWKMRMKTNRKQENEMERWQKKWEKWVTWMNENKWNEMKNVWDEINNKWNYWKKEQRKI